MKPEKIHYDLPNLEQAHINKGHPPIKPDPNKFAISCHAHSAVKGQTLQA
jgi:hypothetical protein